MSSTRLSVQLADRDWRVLAFEAQEAIGEPYRIVLRLVAEHSDLPLDTLLRQPAWLDLGNGRGLHGLVWRATQEETGKRLSHYRIELRPALAWLEQRHNCRIFQQRSVPQILAALLAEHGIQGDACRFALGSEYPPREHCVQYAESDLNFLQRLCEEEGLHFHFQHQSTGHALVFGDDQTVFPRLEATQCYQPEAGAPSLRRFGVRLETRSASVTLRDHDFNQPRLLLEAQASVEDRQAAGLELYAYPGRFDDRSQGRLRARRLLEATRLDCRQAEGSSDQPLLACGHFMDVRNHPREDCNQLWLLTGLQHHGYQPQVLEEYAEADPQGTAGQPGYHNRFTAIPWDVPVRLAPRHLRPRVPATQSARVLGPENEEIHCDAEGRVQVQFHWERQPQDLNTRAWLRVASGWAGNHYGAWLLPRVGMQVLVGFLDGELDQPLITGCLYDAEHTPPYPLPEHKTRSVLRTRSTPDGQAGNELSIDDRAGAEQLYLHAQRDWEQHVRHNLGMRIGNRHRETVQANSHSERRGEEQRIIHGNRLVELKADDHLSTQGSQHVKLGQGQFIEAGREIHLNAGERLVIEAGSELTVQAGGSFIRLDAGGVSLVGPQVKLNAGGSAGQARTAQPRLPTPPQMGQTATAVATPSCSAERPPAPSAPPQPSQSQMAAARITRELGASRCPVCESCGEGQCQP
ncbi:type IV secretion protein Rhs [Pseudomonas flexibilis]|uniref:Type VI secretion system secreted protein VgrG n=1 Tax=Pseudomonas flexibilis TaxID=706570 RepID=A0A1N6RLT9_9PSED|nr:type VI secretion system tip protein TssI/VgrG [Pseudomonas flexibilis]KHL68377.1 type IV secretion protein Rhs [Pseudomonas flexibilis]SIQ29785.1 type VI secretion system secreted protein VgrG [Pseudomonas flexibilis]